MHDSKRIRVLALGLIRDRDRLFLSQGFDPVEQRTFYRAMGGGVDFGEHSRDALQREFREEIGAELEDIHYLGCLESIFTYNGKTGHEIAQLYRCRFIDLDFYEREQIPFLEGKRSKLALWVDIEECLAGKLTVVPPAFLDYL
ncbi:NTP pyrophosphohydrolase containing a Zn-finger [Rubidibacter lacunae KORDI 51-2]|uniref:NTP pyrophosphohydrolase containing a Zn-finger n=1 Tax=Rubidibacter lacunae KORDI 51-2 TaxID=582515 RepID=U5DJM9_9CHRO|nr:NUDIX hydrolase [Rubidibacter lacunae]ERN40789.1 NTP pyrophosphohydrolase containing a Zn-finger [Rubidibacter lacunae KORDI 51-2]